MIRTALYGKTSQYRPPHRVRGALEGPPGQESTLEGRGLSQDRIHGSRYQEWLTPIFKLRT